MSTYYFHPLTRAANIYGGSAPNTQTRATRGNGRLRDTEMMSANRTEEAKDASVYEAEISVNDETLRRKIAVQRENFIIMQRDIL